MPANARSNRWARAIRYNSGSRTTVQAELPANFLDDCFLITHNHALRGFRYYRYCSEICLGHIF
jgi:hypothetical protein